MQRERLYKKLYNYVPANTKKGYRKPIIHKKSYCKYEHMEGKYPGDKVQIDIKYVPAECIRFPSYGNRYYQITGIGEYSRKRVLQ